MQELSEPAPRANHRVHLYGLGCLPAVSREDQELLTAVFGTAYSVHVYGVSS